jgi:hypothetical protein
MYQNYKIIACTPAGRKNNMEILIPYILSCSIIDRYDIWINTENEDDLDYLNSLNKFDKINLINCRKNLEQKEKFKNIEMCYISTLYKNCNEEDAIYIKIDDDVCWIEPDTIKKLISFRINHPEYFLVYPLIINNGGCSYILNLKGKIKLPYMGPEALATFVWKTGEFAKDFHELFISSIKNNTYKQFYTGENPYSMYRVSINMIAFFGRDPILKYFNSVDQNRDDEEWFSNILPVLFNRLNCIYGDTIISHLSYGPQKDNIDKTNIREQYKELQNLNLEVQKWKIKNSWE